MLRMVRVGQNRVFAPYMTACMVNFMPKISYIPINVWYWPALRMVCIVEQAACSFAMCNI